MIPDRQSARAAWTTLARDAATGSVAHRPEVPQTGSTALRPRLDPTPADAVRLKRALAAGWLVFAVVNVGLMVHYRGAETIPYHLIWASYALLYGLVTWSRRITLLSFAAVSAATGLPLLAHARMGLIGWSECSEIVLMGVIVSLLIWHVDRQRAAQRRIAELLRDERERAQAREVTAKFGSHEVRTRLTVARGLVEMIRSSGEHASVRDDATTVLQEIDKATATATKLLDLVRVESPNPWQPLQVDHLVRVVVGRWAAAVERTWAASSTVGQVLGDGERLEAALDCLIENAVKFTATGDSVRVDARREGDDVVISVSDSGCGIPEEDLARVFQLFQTGSTAGERAGSGLGLALVDATVKARGGTISVTSQVGIGSCFTMRFPHMTSVGDLVGPAGGREGS